MSEPLTLPSDLAAKVQARIESGAESDAVDVVRAGIAALEAEDARRLVAIREKVARSLADPRPSVPAEDVFDRVDALLAAYNRK